MLLFALSALALVLLAPLSPGEVLPPSAWDSRVPVVMQADSTEALSGEGFDAAKASRRIVEGAAQQLRARGLSVQRDLQSDAFLVTPESSPGSRLSLPAELDLSPGSTGRRVTLSVGFNYAGTKWASGSETRFGGDGDASWRLASRVQRNLVEGLRDVLQYDSHDRGVLDMEESDRSVGMPVSLSRLDPWVTSYPLFATNPRELSLLASSDVLDLISAALANAVNDYMDPSYRTPPRNIREGWRSSASWQPVSPRAITQAPDSPLLALTFDGGASAVPTPAILKALREAGVRATMFMTADFVERNPELVVQMATDGHEFGNHSSTHPDMTKLSDTAIVSELSKLESAVYALTGRSTRPWFRPPFGAHDDRLLQVVADQGYYAIMWTADSADWRPELSAETVESRLLTYAAPGAILIQHLGSPQSAQVLAEVLARLKGRGFSFGTLSEVLGAS